MKLKWLKKNMCNKWLQLDFKLVKNVANDGIDFGKICKCLELVHNSSNFFF